jgi:hypothetical protein
MTKADGKADDASGKIEHVEEQLYDIFTYLPYPYGREDEAASADERSHHW